jgi:hypothetical protein
MIKSRWMGLWLVVGALCLSFATSARAQPPEAPNPNSGSLHFTGGTDDASAYVFRGFVQEQDPKLTVFPYGDVAVALTSGDGPIRSTVVNVGVWNSLNTGASGAEGPSGHTHYEEDFYARVNWLFRGGIAVGGGYMARTSPNNMFDTQQEIQLKIARTDRLNPYAFLATELTVAGQADNGLHKGTYLELGGVPNFAVGRKARLAIPVKAGFSVHDYYELAGTDHRFGFFDVGALLTVPLRAVPARFGAWNVHGGAEIYLLGDTTRAANDGQRSKPVGSVGVGVIY